MHLLDAQTTSWASQGGMVPQEQHNHQILTNNIPYAQPRGGIAKEQEQRSNNINKEDPPEEQLAKEQDAGADQIWVKGANEEDDARYRRFLTYMEEKRQEARMLLQKEDDKKKEAKEKEARWALLRESMAFLKENSHTWQERKVEECERLKQEAKEDRLAVTRMKKKRYGIKKAVKGGK